MKLHSSPEIKTTSESGWGVFSKVESERWQNITLSMFSEDVNFKLLKECFVVLIFAYNLTFLKTSVNCSHWYTK